MAGGAILVGGTIPVDIVIVVDVVILAQEGLMPRMGLEARAQRVLHRELPREDVAVGVRLVADDTGEFGQRIVFVGMLLRLSLQPALEVVQIDRRAMSCQGSAHTRPRAAT